MTKTVTIELTGHNAHRLIAAILDHRIAAGALEEGDMEKHRTFEELRDQYLGELGLPGWRELFALTQPYIDQLGRKPAGTPCRPGDMAAIYAEENGVSYEQAPVSCNMD